MSDPRGSYTINHRGKDYTLWMGMSVLADLQSKHGQDVLQKLEAPEGAGPNWVPDLNIVLDMFRGALKRHHAADIEADPYLVDDILSENKDAFSGLMAAAFPDQAEAKPGNGKRPKRAA